MRKLIVAALIGVTVLPTGAVAQSRGELHRDRQEIREEQRELNRAYRDGDRRDIRDERRDVRDARQEYREDLRDRRGQQWNGQQRGNQQWDRRAWQDNRNANRALYARGNWRAPFRYQAFRTGARIAPQYYGGRYAIVRPAQYRLPPAHGQTRWVRHYDDVLLVDWRRGIVLDVVRNFFR